MYQNKRFTLSPLVAPFRCCNYRNSTRNTNQDFKSLKSTIIKLNWSPTYSLSLNYTHHKQYLPHKNPATLTDKTPMTMSSAEWDINQLSLCMMVESGMRLSGVKKCVCAIDIEGIWSDWESLGLVSWDYGYVHDGVDMGWTTTMKKISKTSCLGIDEQLFPREKRCALL